MSEAIDQEAGGAPVQTQTQHDQHGRWRAPIRWRISAATATVNQRIADAARRAGRAPDSVRLLPVSKTVDEARIRRPTAGCRYLGENKLQEVSRKWEAMADLTDLRWSVIGHLQTNKAKLVARYAAEFQALDSLRVAEALDRRLQAEGRALDVYVQINTSGEASKYGLQPDEAAAFLRQMPAYSGLRVRGFMTLALFSAEAGRVRQCLLRTLRDRLRQTRPPASGWTSCRWACRATMKSPSRKAPPWCAWAGHLRRAQHAGFLLLADRGRRPAARLRKTRFRAADRICV